ncbi:copper chaperone for superoxide dismutase-like [Stegodyphus dumicola]|uniref:copper chaperone for superoxide dismutase-like n=1 Tax=Stegodyphus dumicola TaxID=202533 RepID=UPI0015AEB64F|nr:copper chaperone for superoxide dismutase-like [Stegodyphus dumicola]
MDSAPRSIKASKVEFDVNLMCNNCASSVRNALSRLTDVNIVDIDVERQSVIVETSLPSQTVKEAIQSTGKRAVLKGYGISDAGITVSAVAELKGESILGVIRFHQDENNLCIIDGTIDGLKPGEHGLHIHEFGDLSQGFENLGPHFNPTGSKHGGPNDAERHYGDLGNITASANGRASFRKEDHLIKVWDIIGRSIVVTSDRDDLGHESNESSKIDGNSGYGLACAIIARSSGLFQNPKRICQCDGISVWDEQNLPSSL